MSNGSAILTKLRTRAPNLAPCTHNDATHLNLVPFMAAESHLNEVGFTPFKTLQLTGTREKRGITS